MSQKLPITVVMIARDEAKRLPQSLGSVADWVSEIVVVINDCTDDTAAVAESFGAKVSEHPFQNLRDQKTVALGKATQPWILNLDADEVVSPELRTEIVAFFNNAEPEVNGVWFARRLWFMNRWLRHGDVYPDRVLRLFKNGKGRLGGVEEHDCFIVEGRTVRFKQDLLHYSHDSIANHVKKINFFSDFFLQRAIRNDRKVSPLQAALRAGWRFFRAYFFRLGLLDGFAGFYMAQFAAFATFIKYAKLYEYYKTPRKSANSAGNRAEQEISVIMVPNDAYAIHAGVAMVSILRHAGVPGRFHFYLLQEQGELSVENLRQLDEIVREYGAKLEVVTVAADLAQKMNCAVAGNYLPANTFYRILIPQLLPQLSRCIYLDCDLAALDDLTLLWEEDLAGAAIGAVRDWHVEGRGLRKYEQIRDYFNSGVLYMNLDRCRQKNYIAECLRLMTKPEITGRYPDQDVLNLVFCEDLRLLHPRWNIQTDQRLLCKLHDLKHGESFGKEIRRRPGIAHYSGRKRKPWYFDMKHEYALAYWENFQWTPWGRASENTSSLLCKVRIKNWIARSRDFLRSCLTVKITPKRGIYRIIALGVVCVNIMPADKEL